MSSSGRFEELRLDFVDTSAKYDGTYSTTICHWEEDEQVLLRTAEYDIPCYVPFPSPPNRECAVLLRNWGTGEAPFETYKRLAAHAWRLLPFPLQQAVFHQADESFHVDGNSGRSCWTWLLWCDLLLRVDTVDSDTCQFDPFTRSARLIEEWGLNTDSPHPPDWLQVDLPDTGDGARQPDDGHGKSVDDNDAMLGIGSLMKKFSVPQAKKGALEKRFERFRRKNFEGWQEVTEPKPNQPRYLYRVGAVRHIVVEV